MEVAQGYLLWDQRVSVICSELFRKDIFFIPPLGPILGDLKGKATRKCIFFFVCEYFCNGRGRTCCPHFAHEETDAVILRKYSREFKGMESHAQSKEDLGLFIIYDSGGIDSGSQCLTSFLVGPVYTMYLNLEQKATCKS